MGQSDLHTKSQDSQNSIIERSCLKIQITNKVPWQSPNPSSCICILSPSPTGERRAYYTLRADGQPHNQCVQSRSTTIIIALSSEPRMGRTCVRALTLFSVTPALRSAGSHIPFLANPPDSQSWCLLPYGSWKMLAGGRVVMLDLCLQQDLAINLGGVKPWRG